MFYPDHPIRSYCLYLGSLETPDGKKLDLGVYEEAPGMVSHAIAYGPEGWEYLSGDISLNDDRFNLSSAHYMVNVLLYKEYLLVQRIRNDKSVRS